MLVWVLALCLLGRQTKLAVAQAPLSGEERPPPPASDKCWIYTHLQKCGGSTVKKILFDYWGKKSTTYDSGQWKLGDKSTEGIAKNLASKTGLNVAAGGYTEALRRTDAFANDKCRWFTVFRHPVSRMVSAYYYCRQDPTDQLCASAVVPARTNDLEAFAKHWGNYAVRQFALNLVTFGEVVDDLSTRLPPAVLKLPGWYMLKRHFHERGGSTELGRTSNASMFAMLQPVQDLLRDRYVAVGLLEEFNTTLSLFNVALDMPGMDWHREFANVGKENVDVHHASEKREDLKEALTNSEIKKHMWLDLLLYDHAVQVFHAQAQQYGLE